MNSKWLRMILANKNKEVKISTVIDGELLLLNIVAVEDETDSEIILSTYNSISRNNE